MRAGFFPSGAFSDRALGTTAAPYLKTAGGARSSAMGGASAAAARGADAVFLNPAALAHFEEKSKSEAAFDYKSSLESSYAGSAAYARHMGGHGAGAVGVIYQSQGAQSYYNVLGDATGRFTPTDLSVGAWYAHRFGFFALAGGLKLIRSALADKTANTFAADFGLLALQVAEIGEGPLDLGVSAQHLGPPLKLGESADPLPMKLSAGAQWHSAPNLDFACDLVVPADEDPYFAIGVESRFSTTLPGAKTPWTASLRGGLDQSRTRGIDGFTGVSLGAGFDFSALRLDYAWLPFGDLGSVNRVSLAFRF